SLPPRLDPCGLRRRGFPKPPFCHNGNDVWPSGADGRGCWRSSPTTAAARRQSGARRRDQEEEPSMSDSTGSAGQECGQEYWDDRYSQSERLWSGEPNEALVAEIAKVSPGRALDLGSGEGGDAVWLARSGWHVTAV